MKHEMQSSKMGPSRRQADILVSTLSVVFGLFAILSALQLSERVGRLALPPAYDDISYFISGFDAFLIYLHGGLTATISELLHHHAPLQSALSMLGDILFGANIWSAYYANGLVVIGLVFVLLAFTRSLIPLARLSIVIYVLSVPLIGNVVTEFRPDLHWGLLCGIAIYLLLSESFILGTWKFAAVTGAIVAIALLDKPTASPATAALIAAAVLVALFLQRPERSHWHKIGIFVVVACALSGPYFVLNYLEIYRYIHAALVEQADINRYPGSALDQFTYYSYGIPYPYTLSKTLWLGFALFIANCIFLSMLKWRVELKRHVGFAFIVLVSYLIPTLSLVKTPFLGGIFYGTFLLFTIHGLVLALSGLDSLPRGTSGIKSIIPLAGPTLLIALALIMNSGWKLMNEWDQKQSVEWSASATYLENALVDDVKKNEWAHPPIVFVTASYPLSADSINLISRWRNVSMSGEGGNYIRSLDEEIDRALKDNYVLISEKYMGAYPGSVLGISLLNWIRKSNEFVLVTKYDYGNNLSTYLFRKFTRPQ